MIDYFNETVANIYRSYPWIGDFFRAHSLTPPPVNCKDCLYDWFARYEYYELDEVGVEKAELPGLFRLFFEHMLERMAPEIVSVDTVLIKGGHDKEGRSENTSLLLRKGQVVSVVGPTGAGKSCLLADIEWLAQGDTPSGRRIWINGAPPPAHWRYSLEKKLVAQLTQNMNFIMDVTVEEFLVAHCESWLIRDCSTIIMRIITAANNLTGEPIAKDTPVTALSGGQARALMIADTAYISTAPIVLIDEIENAGINRQAAIDLLVQSEKIVLIATHDPILALNAQRRVVIQNGGIRKIIETGAEEKALLKELEAYNNRLLACREMLRSGKVLAKGG
jgi:ABC-type lipoprotein export system ATPase subunit